MIYPIERLLVSNNKYRGDSTAFIGLEHSTTVENDWQNWVLNFLESLKNLRGDDDLKCYHILNNFDKWASSLFDVEIKCNRIVFSDNKWSYLPPYVEWISPSGRFACIELGILLDLGNYYLLWDTVNEELLKLEFHDLLGMNEKKGLLYCRTHSSIHEYGYNLPFQINTNNINSKSEWVSLENTNSNQVYFEERKIAQELVIKIFGTEDDGEFDLSNTSIGELIFA